MGNTADKGIAIAINPTVALGSEAGGKAVEKTAEELGLAPDIPPPPKMPQLPATPEPAQQADAAVAQQRRRNAGGVSRSDTILTSPLGVADAAPVARKTLLGE